MDNIHTALNDTLLRQTFNDEQQPELQLATGRFIAQMYAKLENAISVLSDLRANTSYIYNGGIAAGLGLPATSNVTEIKSIWEEDIFGRIHPDDLLQKYALELHFFQLLKSVPVVERGDYQVQSTIRMKNREEQYVAVQHRIFYILSAGNGSIWLALCLYNHCYLPGSIERYQGMIVNPRTGQLITPDKEQCNDLLSHREKEILRLIKNGRSSKEIAGKLSISINTVHRHRQNILEKLKVSNSLEACSIAEIMGLI
ncbi:helix-turn-helix transcriptional regulator [Chitinophaga polysaccharea]|uniref:response regulator transcription factor n=1 Tax=Chitinophaga polysaccharea TaxID=1293035 RepID=UPI00145543FE|nr:helix-turn-helix transcriptional regulator [Chitinophaga polysaccharea]NLR60769.1 helix-turn-helix transcriptional regulator [Chitinophaga polysaccharea]